MTSTYVRSTAVATALTLAVSVGWAQRSVLFPRALASNVVVPQARAFATANRGEVRITGVDVGVSILHQVATTTMEMSVRNPTRFRLESELIVPVPEGAVVRGFTFQGAAAEATAQVLPREEARRLYDEIVARIRDPALLEFVGCNLIRSSVFPVEPGGTQRVRLVYEHVLQADGDRFDYVLPRSESLAYRVAWRVRVTIRAKRPLSTVYSPSHKLITTRTGPKAMKIQIAPEAHTEPGSFRLSYLLEQDGVSASLFAYPDPKLNGGYFLLLAGLPAQPPRTGGIKRELTLVLDRSGSMSGEKIEQVKEAAFQILSGLEPGEAFNLIVYNETVEPFSKVPVVKSSESVKAARAYLHGINARGGTNIHDALVEALRQKPVEGMLPIVLFLTDGLPTVGQTSEVAIRNAAIKGNPYNRRIFTFGVGVDVNTPLLDKIASETRAAATYVLPNEDVEVKVARVFKRLSGPILAEPVLNSSGAGEGADHGRLLDVMPARLPDLFEGDQLVVLGRYTGIKPLAFRLSGNYLGKTRSFAFSFPLDDATTKNAFVPRLWASRKIGVLVDAIRQSGGNGGLRTIRDVARADPKMQELVDEIVRLSMEFGILTEYTAFLAREGTDLARRDLVLREAGRNFVDRAVSVRSGLGSVNQSLNNDFNQSQNILNRTNGFFDADMNRVSITTVQQVNDRAFFLRNGRWVDSRLVEREDTVKPRRVIEFGSEAFRALARKLAEQSRQGTISLAGDILLEVDGEPILVKGPRSARTTAPSVQQSSR